MKPIHMADASNLSGGVSLLCAAVGLRWTVLPQHVTCPECLAALKAQEAGKR